MYYLDSSALVKLVAREPESEALFEFLGRRNQYVSSALARVEVLRAVGRTGGPTSLRRRAEKVLSSVALIRVDDGILERASTLEPTTLWTLDAIHLATGLALGGDLTAFVAYDRRLVVAARKLGLDVQTPGA